MNWMRSRRLALAAGLLAQTTLGTTSADWPMWRYDAGRTASSPEQLPPTLHLQWTRQYPARVQVWDDPLNHDLMPYDKGFEPVVMGHRMFLGFNDTDKVVALDTRTGAELWTFYTDGPVRLPPAASQGKVCFTSDDGHLYCVNAEDGRLVWKFRGGPSERKVIGNGRVISAWPARGGPVIREGKVYFAASIWPFMGTFIYALDAETGRIAWVNDGTGAQFIKQPHSAPSFGGVAPQGALVATKDCLLAPGGRSVPAAFDRHTGQLLHFNLNDGGKGNGGSFVAANDAEFFVHTRYRGTRAYELKTGKKSAYTLNEPVLDGDLMYSAEEFSFRKTAMLEAQQRLAAARKAEALARTDAAKAAKGKAAEETAKTAKAFTMAKDKVALAEQAVKAASDAWARGWQGPLIQAVGPDHKVRWELAAGGLGDLIKARNRLYAAGSNSVFAVELPQGSAAPKVVWSQPVEGVVHRLLAANGRLFAVTVDGLILAFGSETATSARLPGTDAVELGSATVPVAPVGVSPTRPRHANEDPTGDSLQRKGVFGGTPETAGETPRAPQQTASSRPRPQPAVVLSPGPEVVAQAKAILKQADTGEGYALCFGVDDGQLLTALVAESHLRVVAVDLDAAKVDALRRQFDATGLYGARITVHQGDPLTFKAPPYFAGLVVIGKSLVPKLAAADILKQVYESVRPYGGALWLSSSTVDSAALACLEKAKTVASAGGQMIFREGALPGAGDWTHQYGNIANTVKSDDTRVKAPLGLLWFGGNSNLDVLPRHGHGPPEQVVAGRLFLEGMNSLCARDVYTGRILWKRQFDDLGTFGIYFNETYEDTPLSTAYNQKHIPGANARGANFVATSDAVYLAISNACQVLDARTGRSVRAISMPGKSAPGAPPQWAFIGICGDTLLGGVGFAHFNQRYGAGPAKSKVAIEDYSASAGLAAFDRHTGALLWQTEARHSFLHNGIVAGNGRVYCLDRLPASAEELLKRRGDAKLAGYRIAAFELKTGKLLWEATQDIFGTWLGYAGERDLLLQAGAAAKDRLKDEAGQGMITYRGRDGAVQWRNLDLKYTGPCILHHDVIFTSANSYQTSSGAFNLLDGSPHLITNPLTGRMEPWRISRAYGCNNVVASENLLTFRSGAAGYYDLETQSGTGNLGGFKSGCTANLIIADGVLNAPDYTRTCSCAYQNQTSLALIHMPEMEMWTYSQFGLDAPEGERIQRVGINFGAPGDRRAADGTLWLEFPSTGGNSPGLPIEVRGRTNYYHRHAALIQGTGPSWVAASGVRDVESIVITPEIIAPSKTLDSGKSDDDDDEAPKAGQSGAKKKAKAGAAKGAGSTSQGRKATPKRTPSPANYTVRLYFAEPDDVQLGQRVFGVSLQGRAVLDNFDIVKEAGGVRRAIVREFKGVTVQDRLTVALSKAAGAQAGPVLSGIELIGEH